MKQKYQWQDNAYEPGLFTFYKQNGKIKAGNNKVQKERKTVFRMKKGASDKKINRKTTSRYVTQYGDWNNPKEDKTESLRPKEKYLQLMDIRKQKIKQRMNDSIEKEWKCEEMMRKKRNKSLLHLKTRNINQIFKYDISCMKTKMFVVPRENEQTRMESNKSQQRMIRRKTVEEDQHSIVSFSRDNRLKTCKNQNLVRMGSTKCNFVQCLAEKQRRKLDDSKKDRTSPLNRRQVLLKRLNRMDNTSKLLLLRQNDKNKF